MGLRSELRQARRHAQARVDELRDRIEDTRRREDRKVAAIKRAYNAHFISDAGVRFIASKEGFRSRAYQDSGGIWTIGYGHTLNVHAGDVVTRQEALDLLQEDVEWAVEGALALIDRKLNRNEIDAVVSLIFNIGIGGFEGSTVRWRINHPQAGESVAEAWAWWNKDANGNVLEGLVIRRREEIATWRREVKV